MKKNDIIEYKKWSYKVVKTLGNIVHVRPLNGNGRVRMHSPTTTLINENGVLKEFNIFSNEPVKQENTTPTKEGLHTQEWTRHLGDIYSGDNLIASLNKIDGNYPIHGDLIVKAVNERQALLDSHRELLEVLEAWVKYVSDGYLATSYQNQKTIQKSITIINNAKNIKQ